MAMRQRLMPRLPPQKDLEEVHTFVKEIPEEYKCIICIKLMRDPQVTECCGQHFCWHCLQKWCQYQCDKECPCCRTSNCKYIRYLPMKREIEELNIYCTNRQQGCTQTINLKDVDEHDKVCNFKSVLCICGNNYLRKDLAKHKQTMCPDRQIKCTYCGERGAHKTIQSRAHQNRCPDFPITCPNRCGAREIKRKNLENHRLKCPLEPIECSFKNVGCHERGRRKDFDEHRENATPKHLTMLMESFAKLSDDHDKLQKAHTELKKEHNELKRKVNTLAKKTAPVSKGAPGLRTSRRGRGQSRSSYQGSQQHHRTSLSSDYNDYNEERYHQHSSYSGCNDSDGEYSPRHDPSYCHNYYMIPKT